MTKETVMGRSKSWFRITWSLRTLLLLIALAAVVLAWQVPRWRRQSAIKTLEALGAALEGKNEEVNVLNIPSHGHGFGGTATTGGDAWKKPRQMISLIGEVDTLESITIEPGDLGSFNLAPWLRLHRLSHVDIDRAALSKANLETIAALPALQSLTLSNVYLEGGSLEPLIRCKGLHTLSLANCHIGVTFHPDGQATPIDKSGSESEASRELRAGTKQMPPCAIDDSTLPIVRRMPSLQRLNLRNLPVDAAKLKALRGMESLTMLSLSSTDIDDSAVDILLSLPKLKNVGLTDTVISRNGVLRLLRESQITRLDVDQEIVDDLATHIAEEELMRIEGPNSHLPE